ncbi:antitoxin VapB family protein [Natronolimnohabitans innermongolicus]|uniref:Antitoxin n=1 Tax=Natronolimnohabitans innermongolicus JCM 12255 TaxID=1227499 RepID=L9XHM7_9EURY|nr:antitoxin VapB family protein [Natronolimnohabitans innermongolicus]ELY61102.1 hypothetical protein C493_03250 [Natronolimnohabitans innermongolicus JCM 12255]
MSKNISISDEVHRELKREKGDRSFSDVISDHLEERRQLADVTGAGVLDRETHTAVKEDIAGFLEADDRESTFDGGSG